MTGMLVAAFNKLHMNNHNEPEINSDVRLA